MKRYLLLLVCLSLFQSCKKNEGDIYPATGEFVGKTLNDYFITAIAFEQSGTAWLGTLDQGLLKYENGKVTVFDSTNSSIPNKAIWDIEVDPSGNVWVASSSLFKVNGGTITRYQPREFGLPDNHIQAIAVDQNGIVWFSCSSFRSGGLVRYDGKQFQSFTPQNSKLPGNFIQSITVDARNNVWLAVNDGVTHVSLTSLSTLDEWRVFGQNELGFSPYYFGDLITGNGNDVLVSLDYGLSSTVATGRPQMFSFDGTKTNMLKLPDEDKKMYSTKQIFRDNAGSIWASFSDFHEYGVYRNGKWAFASPGTEDIFSFGQHPSGEMWLGTGHGVLIVKPSFRRRRFPGFTLGSDIRLLRGKVYMTTAAFCVKAAVLFNLFND